MSTPCFERGFFYNDIDYYTSLSRLRNRFLSQCLCHVDMFEHDSGENSKQKGVKK